MDMMGKRCMHCHKGKYKETSVHDDWEGKLHCPKCGHEVVRHQEKKEEVKVKESFKSLTFRQYLSILEEDTAQDIEKLQADISTLDATINQRTAPLVQQKQRLTKLLMQKQKQKEQEDSRTAAKPGATQQPQQAQPVSKAYPGATTAGTPGATGYTVH